MTSLSTWGDDPLRGLLTGFNRGGGGSNGKEDLLWIPGSNNCIESTPGRSLLSGGDNTGGTGIGTFWLRNCLTLPPPISLPDSVLTKCWFSCPIRSVHNRDLFLATTMIGLLNLCFFFPMFRKQP